MIEERRFADVRASDDGDEWRGFLFAQDIFMTKPGTAYGGVVMALRSVVGGANAPLPHGPSRYYRDSVPFSSHPASAHPAFAPETRPTGFSLYQFFAPGGLLSKTHPAYEFRRGQSQMAQAVEEALEEKRHLIVEAGTGTGKTLAYLLPVIRSGKRVIISTGTKNLQEQLFSKMSQR